MGTLLSEDQGRFLVKFARNVIEKYVRKERLKKPEIEDWMIEKRGVFTTIETYPENELRGCIGIPYPIKPLIEALLISAKSACVDPRFPPLGEDELDNIVVEISVLSKPEEIKVKNKEEYLDKIVPGKDGLILKYKIYSGLFLPQVWEKIRDKKEFLDALCLKAGLPTEYWKNKEAKIYKFNTQIFKEIKPNGKIIEIKL
jgi:uncharacterized protein (TIGR00296 family)